MKHALPKHPTMERRETNKDNTNATYETTNLQTKTETENRDSPLGLTVGKLLQSLIRVYAENSVDIQGS